MKTKKIIGTILISIGIFLGVKGYQTILNNKTEIDILDIQMNFSNQSKIELGYSFLGGSAILLILGSYLVTRKN